MMAVDSVTSAPAAQFEMEPLAGGFFAWRNINKLYMSCAVDGSLKFSKQTSDELGVKITIEEQLDDPVVVDPAKQHSAVDANGLVSKPIQPTPQNKPDKSCYPEMVSHSVRGGGSETIETCSAKEKYGWAIIGHNEGGVHEHKTWKECLDLCCKDPKCKSFDYNSDGTDKRKCYLSHHTMEEVGPDKMEDWGTKYSYGEISVTPLTRKTPKEMKRVAFRTEMGRYISVDQQGQLNCNALTLEDNAMFDLIRPIETGAIGNFIKCKQTFLGYFLVRHHHGMYMTEKRSPYFGWTRLDSWTRGFDCLGHENMHWRFDGKYLRNELGTYLARNYFDNKHFIYLDLPNNGPLHGIDFDDDRLFWEYDPVTKLLENPHPGTPLYLSRNCFANQEDPEKRRCNWKLFAKPELTNDATTKSNKEVEQKFSLDYQGNFVSLT